MKTNKKPDIAWGFFYTFAGERYFQPCSTRRSARLEMRNGYESPGPILRVSPPKPKRKAKK